MNANDEKLHQTLVKLVNRVRTESTDSIQAIDYLLNILECLEHSKEVRLESDSLLSECIETNDLNSDSTSELANELTNELNSELNSELTNESDSGQQSSEEGSTNESCTNDLKNTNKKSSSSLIDLILQLLSIIVNHLIKQVHNKQDAELLINQWKHCLCFKKQQIENSNHSKHNLTTTTTAVNFKNGNLNQQDNLLINTNHSPLFVLSSSGIQSDASCSPLSSLTTDCCANNLSTCSLSPSCCFNLINKCSSNHQIAKKCNLNKKNCLDKQNLSTTTNSDDKKDNAIQTTTKIPLAPIPPPPPLPNQNALDKSISNSSLNNQLLTSSIISNLSTNTPPSSINEQVPVSCLLEAPKPKSKMKTLNWSKISVHKVLTSHKPNIWSKLFSKKDDKKSKDSDKNKEKKKEKSNQNKRKAASKKTNKFCSDDDEDQIEEENEFKLNSQRNLFNSTTKRMKKPDDNNNTSSSTSNSANSSTNNLTRLNSTINASNSSINSTTTINSTSTKSKKQSEEDLMNIVQLDFDTLEGLFCQPNNQIVGTMIANFSGSNGQNCSNGSAPNSCPNSPATNRRLLLMQQQQQTNPQNHLFKSNLLHSNHQLNNIGYHQQLHTLNQQTNQANYLNQHQLNSTSKLNTYFCNNLTNQSSQNVGRHQLTNKLNNKLELNGRNSPSTFNSYFTDTLERKQALKRCSGEFNTTLDFMHNLLDSKRSLNINIFLKQFRSVCSNDGEIEIVRLVKQGDHAAFGAEKLVHLIKLLPDQTEIDLLKAHSDDLLRLPLAERFLLQLMSIPKLVVFSIS